MLNNIFKENEKMGLMGSAENIAIQWKKAWLDGQGGEKNPTFYGESNSLTHALLIFLFLGIPDFSYSLF